MKKQLLITVFILSIFISFPNSVQAQTDPSVSPVPTQDVSNQLMRLSNEVSALRSDQYRQVIDAADKAGNSANTVISIVGVVAGLFAIAFGIMAFFVGKDLNNSRVEMKGLVDSAKKMSEEISGYVEQAKKITKETQPKLIAEIEDNRKKLEVAIGQAEKAKETGQNLEKLQKEIEQRKEKELKLSTQLQQSYNELQILSSRASVFSPNVQQVGGNFIPVSSIGSASVSPIGGIPVAYYGGASVSPSYSPSASPSISPSVSPSHSAMTDYLNPNVVLPSTGRSSYIPKTHEETKKEQT